MDGHIGKIIPLGKKMKSAAKATILRKFIVKIFKGNLFAYLLKVDHFKAIRILMQKLMVIIEGKRKIPLNTKSF